MIRPVRESRPKRHLRHAVSVRAYRWMMQRGFVRRIPGEHFHVREQAVHLPRLPRKLSGLRIAHLTDLHVGSILTPDHLPGIVEAVNDTDADMIAVTGDMLDHAGDCIEAVAEAMADLDAPLGAYFVLGNHDYRDDIDRLIAAFNRRGLPLLINQSVRLVHEGCHITIGGIDYASNDDVLRDHVRTTSRHLGGHDDLRVLLAHHPHAFDAAQTCAFDLTLSGHTHGGQLLLRRATADRTSIGLGNLAWRYSHGTYQQGHHHLHVSSGVGSAFPLRVRCPAEINVLRLRTR